ncbi:hypothetical protein FLP41_06485 [Paracoccus marcusii]|nr:hypothetical protein FLP41_06485 [Paracoccus marcusii]
MLMLPDDPFGDIAADRATLRVALVVVSGDGANMDDMTKKSR